MRSTRRATLHLFGICLLFVLLVALAAAPNAWAAGNTYYIDCSSPTNGDGSAGSPWNTLASANAVSFASDTIALRRGTTCYGQLAPQGSGSSATPNTIAAYGTGSRPIIDGGDHQAAIKLYNQEYWTIQDVETVHGNPYGIWVRGDGGAGVVWRGFTINNVVVRDVRGESEPWGGGGPGKGKNSGGIAFKTETPYTILDGITIDNATVYNTQRWAGILVEPAYLPPTDPVNAAYRARNVIVRNSTVHDTYGEGILVSTVENALVENNVAYNTGLAPEGQNWETLIGTPNGIWTFNCVNCTVQYNEAYDIHSPGVDGGAFDVDYYSSNTTYQYNYGHDADGYCVSAFGAKNYATTNTVIRYNVCSNNGREPGANGAAQGDFYLKTWEGGSLNGVQIYNNTSYWNPASNESALVNVPETQFTGSMPNFFKNNIIYSAWPKLVDSNTGLSLNNNLYWYTGSGSPSWKYGSTTYTSFSAYQSGSGQDAQGKFQDPLLNNPTSHSVGKPTTAFTLQAGSPAINAGADVNYMGSRDFFGNPIPQGGSYDIGAYESSSSGSAPTNLLTNADFETGSLADGWGGGYGAAAVAQSNAQSGQRAMKLAATGSGSNGAEQTVANLQPNTQYTLTFYAKTGSGSEPVYVGVQDFDSQGTTNVQSGTGASYGAQPISITFTTGAANTSAKVWIWRGSSSTDAYVDNVALTRS